MSILKMWINKLTFYEIINFVICCQDVFEDNEDKEEEEEEEDKTGSLIAPGTKTAKLFLRNLVAVKLCLDLDAWLEFEHATLHYQFEVILMLSIKQMQILLVWTHLAPIIMNQNLAVICVTAYSVL